MQIAQVIGTVVATRKHDKMVGFKIQVVQPLKADGTEKSGQPFVAVDAVGSGTGEIVLVTGGSGARKAVDDQEAPVDAVIVGIVDQIDIDDRL